MSIKHIENINDTNSETYCLLVNGVYTQFRGLFQLLHKYNLKKSYFYLMLAYLDFEKQIERELNE